MLAQGYHVEVMTGTCISSPRCAGASPTSPRTTKPRCAGEAAHGDEALEGLGVAGARELEHAEEADGEEARVEELAALRPLLHVRQQLLDLHARPGGEQGAGVRSSK